MSASGESLAEESLTVDALPTVSQVFLVAIAVWTVWYWTVI